MKFEIKDKVRKVQGYSFEPAMVVAAFKNTKGEERFVVEITEGQCAGMLHVFNGGQLESVDELTIWINKNIFIDSETKERRDIILDPDRNMLFFFAEPLDFDKDDKPVARYWLNEIEGYQDEWFEDIKSRYTK